MQEAPDLAPATKTLINALELNRFAYAIIGGLAVIINGYDRATTDIDAVVWDLDDRLEELISVLGAVGIQFRIKDGIRTARSVRVILLQTDHGVNIDLSMGVLPFEQEVISRASSMRLGDELIGQIATVEDLLIMKLVASRDRDLDDVTRLFELNPDVSHARIRRLVTEFAEALERPEIISNLDEKLKSI